MAGVTVWKARRAKRGWEERAIDPLAPEAITNVGDRILCGWHLGSAYCAEAPIAWLALDETGLFLPMGLTDYGSPGQFRWARPSRKQRASGNASPMAPVVRYGRIGVRAVVPCRRGHLNLVDWSLVGVAEAGPAR